jgi:hypothetical protein
MPFVKGLMLIASFSLIWGVLTAVNAALLRGVVGLSWGILCLGISLVAALLETLAFLGVVDRYFRRARVAAPTLAGAGKREHEGGGQPGVPGHPAGADQRSSAAWWSAGLVSGIVGPFLGGHRGDRSGHDQPLPPSGPSS